MLNQIVAAIIKFGSDNYLKVIIALVITAVAYSIFYFSTYSLRKLKTEILQSYPFGVFFPEGGTWSIGYFIIAILALAILTYFMFKGNFYAGPA